MRISNNKNRKPLAQPHIHIGDYLLLAHKRKKHGKLQFNWTGPYVALEPVTEYIWKIQSMDLSTTLEAHVQRLKQYSDASLMRPVQLLEEVRNKKMNMNSTAF